MIKRQIFQDGDSLNSRNSVRMYKLPSYTYMYTSMKDRFMAHLKQYTVANQRTSKSMIYA